MNEISNNNKHFLLYTLKWMSIYIAIGFIAALLLPFPWSLIGAIGGFMFSGFIGLFTGAIVLTLGYNLMSSWLKSADETQQEKM